MRDLRNKNQTGFTLIELLVVIAIIGLLASVVLLALNSARSKSRDAKRLADVRQIASALEIIYNDAGGYPTCGTTCNQVTPNLVMGTGTGILQASTVLGTFNFTPTYIGSIPIAPTPPDSATCTNTNNQYQYASIGTWYTLTFCLGAQTGGYSAGVRSLTPAGIN